MFPVFWSSTFWVEPCKRLGYVSLPFCLYKGLAWGEHGRKLLRRHPGGNHVWQELFSIFHFADSWVSKASYPVPILSISSRSIDINMNWRTAHRIPFIIIGQLASILYFFFKKILLECSWLSGCVTFRCTAKWMLCYFQVYCKVNQLYIYIYPFDFRFLSHIGYYRIFSRVPCAIQQVPISYLFYI